MLFQTAREAGNSIKPGRKPQVTGVIRTEPAKAGERARRQNPIKAGARFAGLKLYSSLPGAYAPGFTPTPASQV